MGLWFIINSASAKVAKKGALLPQYAEQCNASLRDVGDFSAIDNLAKEVLESGARHVIIEGGDGTVHGVLTAFLKQSSGTKALPDFTIIAGGNTNQVARNIGIPATPKALVKALSEKAERVHFPLLRINDDKDQQAYGFLFSTGALPQVTDYTTSKLHSKGLGGGAAVMGGILKGLAGTGGITEITPLELSVEAASPEQMSGPHLGTIVTTLPGLMLGLDPFWGSGALPLRVTYVAGNYKKLLRNTAGLWTRKTGKDRRADGLHSWTASGLTYAYDGPCVLDGERLSLSPQFTLTPTQPLGFLR